VDVGGWTLRDAPSGTAHTVAAGVPLLGPGAMLVLTADSMAMRTAVNGPCTIVQPEGYPSLNNGGDLLLLADEHGVVMDSVRYEAAWGGNAGVSLERIDPSGPSVASWNWGTCLASGGSTPGQENSIVIQPYDRRGELLEIADHVANIAAKHEGGDLEVDSRREHPSDILDYFRDKSEVIASGDWDHLRVNFLDKVAASNTTAWQLTQKGLSFVAARNLHR